MCYSRLVKRGRKPKSAWKGRAKRDVKAPSIVPTLFVGKGPNGVWQQTELDGE